MTPKTHRSDHGMTGNSQNQRGNDGINTPITQDIFQGCFHMQEEIIFGDVEFM